MSKLHEVVVSRKKKWADEWEVFEDVTPLSCTWAVAPSVSTATFRYEFGSRATERAQAFTQADPLDLFGQYVKIEAFGARSASVPISVWVGLFSRDVRALDGGDNAASGRQVFTALGLEHLLRKIPIDDMHFEQTTQGPVQVVPAGVPFNQRDRLTNGLVGNRSVLGPALKRVFSSDGGTWAHIDILNYLTEFLVNPRTGPQFKVLPVSALAEETVQDLAGLTVWEALNRLIDRRRGLGWRVRSDGKNIVDIHVFSVIDQPITIGDTTIAANPIQVTKRIDPEITIDEFTVTRDDLPVYKTVKVRGAPIIAMFTVNYRNSTLQADWSSSQETAYRDGLQNASNYPANVADRARLNDVFRSQDPAVAGVYLRHRLPPNWNFMVGRGISSTEAVDIPVAPTVTPSGFLVPAADGPPQFAPNKVLLSSLPMLKGVDYSKSPPTVQHDANTQPELREPLVMVYRSWLNSIGTTLSEVRDVRSLGIDGDTLPATAVRMLDTSMGFELAVSGAALPHNWARDVFGAGGPVTEPTQRFAYKSTSLKYQDLNATVAVELDTRPEARITAAASASLDSNTTLSLIIPSLQYWYAADGTIVGLTEEGHIKRIHENNLVIRDDTPQLRTIAAFISSWYGKPRSSIRMTQRSLEYVEPGSLLLTVAIGQHTQQVNTVVSRVTWDLLEQTTTLESQFGELDVLGLVGAKRG